MDAFWYGLEAIFEFIFEVFKPLGRGINFLFILIGFVGAIYWLWYDKFTNKGNHNYMADSGKKKETH